MSTSKTRVLVIDDDSGVRSTLSATLQLSGYAVETAETGESGLDLALSGLFDVILTDMRMPGISGSCRSMAWCSRARAMWTSRW